VGVCANRFAGHNYCIANSKLSKHKGSADEPGEKFEKRIKLT
jgi:hypothetical protein